MAIKEVWFLTAHDKIGANKKILIRDFPSKNERNCAGEVNLLSPKRLFTKLGVDLFDMAKFCIYIREWSTRCNSLEFRRAE